MYIVCFYLGNRHILTIDNTNIQLARQLYSFTVQQKKVGQNRFSIYKVTKVRKQ